MSTQIKTMTVLLRRELWEHRAFWLVPTVVASLMTFALLRFWVELFGGEHAIDVARANVKVAERIDLASFMARTDAAAAVFAGASVPFAVIMAFVVFFYLLDSLYSDRRDRSVLFWRSMPITDLQTVLSKLLTATIAGPLVVLGVLLGAYVVWSGVAALIGVTAGFDYWWIGLNPLAWIKAFGLLFGVHIGFMLVLAPFIGWLLLASAWAPRAPFLWAFLPPLAVALLEEMFFNTNRFLEQVIAGHFQTLAPKLIELHSESEMAIRSGDHKMSFGPAFDLGLSYLAEPRLWIGIAIGAAFIGGAIMMRRYRDDAAY